MADCVTKEFTDQKRVEMSVSEFINIWPNIPGAGNGESLMYLKDWHFVKVCLLQVCEILLNLMCILFFVIYSFREVLSNAINWRSKCNLLLQLYSSGLI